jgi:hypothetical protein
MMQNLKKCFQQCVAYVTLGLAYLQALCVLIGAVVCSWFHKGFYFVKFIKVKNKWYCKVPGFPKALFEHTMMVAGAANMLEYYSQGDDEVTVQVRIPSKNEYDAFCGFRLEQTSATLTGGAFYKDSGLFSDDEFWLCPVTLFLLGRYPKQIYIYKVHKSPTHCPIFMS